MTNKLTQKQLVDLYNKDVAPFQQEIRNAHEAYEKAIASFAVKHLGLTEKEWKELLTHNEDNYPDYLIDDFIEMMKDKLSPDFEQYKVYEYTLRNLVIETDYESEDWLELNKV
jgi:hypothetical protein